MITLNAWGGKLEGPLLEFVKDNSKNADVFCFQEIFDRIEGVPSKLKKYAKLTLLDDLNGVLKGFDFRTAKSGICENQSEILTVFVKNGIEIRKSGVAPVCVRPEFELGIQYLELAVGKKIYTVFNIHGYWDESGKGDTPERFEQSENIIKFMKGGKGGKSSCAATSTCALTMPARCSWRRTSGTWSKNINWVPQGPSSTMGMNGSRTTYSFQRT